MNTGKLRTAVVGASTLLGREVAERLAEREANWSIALFDDEAAAGQMTAAGDEAMVIQPLAPGALSDVDIVFFACEPAIARTHWPEVRASGGMAVDLSGGLAGEQAFVTLSPWIKGADGRYRVDLSTTGIVSAHPAALFLAVLSSRLEASFGKLKLVATVLQPASHYGKAGLDELQAQTAALLTFQSVPREVFDVASAFNLLKGFGPEAKQNLTADTEQIRGDFKALQPTSALELQLIQAPVFHSFAASIYFEAGTGSDSASVARSLHGGVLQVVGAEDELPSNQAAAMLGGMLVSLQQGQEPNGFWVWLAADNLGLSARHAVECAAELARLRPAASVQ